MRTICLKMSGLLGAIFQVRESTAGTQNVPETDCNGHATRPLEIAMINDRPSGIDKLSGQARVREERELLYDPQHHRPYLSFASSIDAKLCGAGVGGPAAWSDGDRDFFGQADIRVAESSAKQSGKAQHELQNRRYIRLEGCHLEFGGDEPLTYDVENEEDWAGISWLDDAVEGSGRVDDALLERQEEAHPPMALARVTLRSGSLRLGPFTDTRWTLTADPLGIDNDDEGRFLRDSLELRWETSSNRLELPLRFLRHGGWDNLVNAEGEKCTETSSLIGRPLKLVLDLSQQPEDEEVEIWLLNSIPRFFRDQTIPPDAGIDFCYWYFYRMSKRPLDQNGHRIPLPFEKRALPHRRETTGPGAQPAHGSNPFCPFAGMRQNP